jgi:hypothetical protein
MWVSSRIVYKWSRLGDEKDARDFSSCKVSQYRLPFDHIQEVLIKFLQPWNFKWHFGRVVSKSFITPLIYF